MIKEFIGAGKTVEEATAAAKQGLNAPAMADIKIDVIALPKGKVLGLFGGRDAQVRAWFDDGKAPKKPKQRPAPKPDEKKAKKEPPKKEAENRGRAIQKPPVPRPAKAQPEIDAEEQTVAVTEADIDIQQAVSYLKGMLAGLKIDDVKVTAKVEDGALRMEIDCSDFGIIIGHRGETLDALQYLTSLAVKKSSGKYVRIALNVGDYREKRTDTLRNLARKNANYVLRTGRRYTFEPMNPYERRIIHTAVQDIEGVESISIGYGQDRRVVLQSTEGPRGGRRAPSRPKAPIQQANTEPKSDRADLPKFGKIEVNKEQ